MDDVSYPYIKDTISFVAVGLYCTIVPIVIIIIVELLNAKILPFQNKKNLPRNFFLKRFGVSLFHGLSLFVFGISIVLLLTEIGKRWVGRLRPHFLSVCKPNVGAISCTTLAASGSIFNSISTGGAFCTGNADDIKEARLSFPSGHSSYSAYTMLFLIIYLQARFNWRRFRYLKALFQVTAFITAYVTAISRLPDYHHRGSDVIGGAILGAIVAIFFTYYLGSVLWEYVEKKPYDFNSRNRVESVSQQPSPASYNNPAVFYPPNQTNIYQGYY
jgi:phosphatidate phosphatase